MANNHAYRGLCDFCGEEAESEVAEIVGLTCSFKDCPEENNLYHQACVEKYLKSIKCEKNRKSGFNCPRGCGKGTKFPDKCKGKITKSHPVTIRSEGNKKRRQAELESLQKAKETSPPAASSKADKRSGASTSSPSHAAAASTTNSKKGKPAASKPVIIRALNVANSRLTNLPPPKTAAELQREALQAARDKLRAEIATNNKQPVGGGGGDRSTKPGGGSSSSVPKQVMTLDEYMAARSASSASTAAATNKLNDNTRSSSAASSAPSAAAGGAGGSRPSTVTNAWSRMTSLGDTTTNSAFTFPSTQSVESFPETPGRETLSSSYAPSETLHSEEYAAPAPVVVRVTPLPGAVAPSTAGTTPRAGATPRAAELSSSLKEIIPGMIDHSKLTKAQRKNLKRAEKKAAARLEETCSLVSCTTGATTEGDDHLHLSHHSQFVVHEEDESDASQHVLNMNTNNYLGETPPLHPASPINSSTSVSSGDGGDTARGHNNSSSISQASLECLVQYKLTKTVATLVKLGFNYEASAKTAIACGGDVHSAMQDLLVAETGAESVYPPGSETPVDISEEITTVQLLKQRYGRFMSPPALDAVIVQCMGNLEEVTMRVQMQDRTIKEQQQYQEMQQRDQQQQGFGYGTTAAAAAAPGSGGGDNSSNVGSLFGTDFGLPDELTWGQSASQHPAASATSEWNSLLGGTSGGSLFPESAAQPQTFPASQQHSHSLFGTSPGLNLGFSPQQQHQQQYMQQSAPQLINQPGISQQPTNHLSGGISGSGSGLWGSASPMGGGNGGGSSSFGTASNAYYGYAGDCSAPSPCGAMGATRLSFEANNSKDNGYLNQGMGQYQQQAYPHQQPQHMQQYCSPGAGLGGDNDASGLWQQQQQQHEQHARMMMSYNSTSQEHHELQTLMGNLGLFNS